MKIHNVEGHAKISFPGGLSLRSISEKKFFAELAREENQHLSAMFYLGGLTKLFEDYDLIQEGVSMAEEAMSMGHKVKNEDPATLIKKSKAEMAKVKNLIELAMKASGVNFTVEEIGDEESDKEGA